MFLSIFTARYAKQDFLYALPKRLIICLATLFISILCTMIAFGATLYLMFGDNDTWILIPAVALAMSTRDLVCSFAVSSRCRDDKFLLWSGHFW
ncbi:hypothetical protein ACSBR2_007257 [Camellia fascicularis]